MKWKNILKMPLSPSRMDERDSGYKQKIINFEKEEITPDLERIVAGQKAGTRVTIEFTMDSTRPTGASKSGDSKILYNLGSGTVKKLGGNHKLIRDTITELYRNLGYNVNESMKPSPTGGKDTVLIIQLPTAIRKEEIDIKDYTEMLERLKELAQKHNPNAMVHVNKLEEELLNLNTERQLRRSD